MEYVQNRWTIWSIFCPREVMKIFQIFWIRFIVWILSEHLKHSWVLIYFLGTHLTKDKHLRIFKLWSDSENLKYSHHLSSTEYTRNSLYILWTYSILKYLWNIFYYSQWEAAVWWIPQILKQRFLQHTSSLHLERSRFFGASGTGQDYIMLCFDPAPLPKARDCKYKLFKCIKNIDNRKYDRCTNGCVQHQRCAQPLAHISSLQLMFLVCSDSLYHDLEPGSNNH